MGLLTKPAALTSISRAIYTWLNSRVDDLYNIIGTTANGRGSLNYLNLSATADLAPGQGRGTFATLTDPDALGTQSVTRSTQVLDPRDPLSEFSAVTDIPSGASTIAIANAAKRYQRYNTNAGTFAANALITTVTGATVGKVYTFFVDNLDAAQYVLFTHTDANTANSFKMKGNGDAGTLAGQKIALAATKRMMGTYVFGDLNGSGVNQFWEL